VPASRHAAGRGSKSPGTVVLQSAALCLDLHRLQKRLQRAVELLLRRGAQQSGREAFHRLLRLDVRSSFAAIKPPTWVAEIPSERPVHATTCGRSALSIMDLIVPGPAFHRNVVPGATGPAIFVDLMSAFHWGQSSMVESTSQTTSSGAAIWISRSAQAGGSRLISMKRDSTALPAAMRARMRRSRWRKESRTNCSPGHSGNQAPSTLLPSCGG
jgi:hypothetical protein